MAAFAVLAPASAFATSGAHFFSASSSVNSAGALVVTFDEAGVGQRTVNYTLTSTATATYACKNGGSNYPSAANKRTVSQTVSTAATFTPRNGRVQGTITTAAPSPGTFTCPKGQTRVLTSVSYTGVTLTDTTNRVSTGVPSASRTFYTLR